VTFKSGGDVAGVRQAATFTKWRLDETDLLPACGTDETFRRSGVFLAAIWQTSG